MPANPNTPKSEAIPILTTVNSGDKITDLLANLRVGIRKLKSGMQTHDLQDAQVALVRLVDTIETELRLSHE